MSKWININDQFPPISGIWYPYYSDVILVAVDSGNQRFVREERFDFTKDAWERGTVGITHWMPLPEPPEQEGE